MVGNKVFVLNGPLSTSFKEVAVPELNNFEVLIKVERTGICGSDIHFYVEGRLGDRAVVEPIGLGHESSGLIVKVGPNVPPARIGERVAIEPWSVCRVCEYCKAGRYQLCGKCSVLDTSREGTLAHYYKVPSDLAYKLPNNLDYEDGALLEPLAVAVHAVCSIGKLHARQNVVIFGCGAVGLLCMAVAKAYGANSIVAVDSNSARLEFAKKYVAIDTFFPPMFSPGERKLVYSERVSALFRKTFGMERANAGADLVIDATGAESCMQMACFVARPSGTFVQVGIGATEAQLPITLLLTKELTMKGSSRYGPGDYPIAIGLASSGKVNLKPLITHRFSFEEALSAFETSRVGSDNSGNPVLKTMISGANDV